LLILYLLGEFRTLSKQQKHNSAMKLWRAATNICPDSPREVFTHLLRNTNLGRREFGEFAPRAVLDGILTNVQRMYTTAARFQKPSVLGLIAKHFSRTQLETYGFSISQRQFETARRRANDENFSLQKHQRRLPDSRAPTDENTRRLVMEYLLRNSHYSTRTAAGMHGCDFKWKMC
jgi:hypothetical protein